MTDQNNKPSDSLEFEISDFDRELADVIPQMKAPAKWSAFNALRHLNRSWRIREIDPEMSIFRAITAEEEAATALFHSLKRLRYPNAKKLKHWNHVHKNAVIVFIDAVSRAFARFEGKAPEAGLILDKEKSPPLLRTRLAIPNSKSGWSYPQPPLNFSFSEGGSNQEKVKSDFAKEINQICSEKNAKEIDDHLKSVANIRNRILYASPNGYQVVNGDIVQALKIHQRNVFIILRAFLMIDPHVEHQLFVSQCLQAFLKMLSILPSDTKFE